MALVLTLVLLIVGGLIMLQALRWKRARYNSVTPAVKTLGFLIYMTGGVMFAIGVVRLIEL